MPITLGTNILSLSAQRALAGANARFGKAVERLGSGLRINSAADDAAGLGVSTALNVKQRILGRARRNISDGLSALEITEGSLSSVSALLTRMAELAEQAANGSFSLTQRRALNTEYQQLDQEIRRITRGTAFNGIDLLAGKKAADNYRAFGTGSVVSGASSDGRYVAGYNGGTLSLYDIETGTSTVVHSTFSAQPRVLVSASGDVFYTNNNQLYRYDRITGTTTQLTDSKGAENFNGLAVSGDGNTVVFTSGTEYADGETLRAIGLGSGTYSLRVSV